MKAILLDEKPKTPVQTETDAEVFDCFDSVTVVQTESAETSGDGVETKRDFVLSGSYSLSDDQVNNEQQISRQYLEPENEFYSALAQRIL